MKSKKLLALCLTATALALTACDSAEIYPSLNNSEITIDDEGKGYFTQDNLDYIYEKLHDSSTTGETVRDYILNQYAKSYIGDYRLYNGEVILIGYDYNESEEGALTEATTTDKENFIKNHEIYHERDFSANETTYEPFDSSKMSSYETRVQLFKDLIFKNIVSTLFNEANSDTYKVDNYFQEVLYARSKFPTYVVGDFDSTFVKNNIYDKKWEEEIVFSDGTYSYPDGMDVFTNGILIDSTISSENVNSIVGSDNSTGLPMLHLDLYEDYVNRELMINILSNLLVEQYIYDNQYTTLSRTQARKINYVSISYTSTNVNAARRLINTYVNNVISGGLKPTEYVEGGQVKEGTTYNPLNFDVLSDAWKGIVDDDPSFNVGSRDEVVSFKDSNNQLVTWTAQDLLSNKDTRFTKVTTHDQAIGGGVSGTSYIDGKNHTYYENTQYGELMHNFALINTDRNDATSTEQWNTFTNSGEYSYEHGLNLQTNNIKIEDYTGYIWGTASDGFSDLPTAITENLFDYSVSLDTAGGDLSNMSSSYVVEVNGRYFLRRTTSLTNKLEDSIVIPDNDNSKFYIVEIEYALNQNKMTPRAEGENPGYYTNEQIEQIAREVGYSLASGDTYTNTAYQYFLEKCDIEYNDQSIYDYMLSTYPDLFED